MNTVRLLKRINLGSYQHYEIETIIEDGDENRALDRAIALMNKGLTTLGEEKIGVVKK